MDRFGPTGKVLKKLVHLLRWSTFPGRTGRKFWLNGSRPKFDNFRAAGVLNQNSRSPGNRTKINVALEKLTKALRLRYAFFL